MNKDFKMFVQDGSFVIENYNNAKPFASFLPSIAGFWGKPIWVFYVNRGQCISSFGTKDKDGAILEFVAANKAWRLTPTQGFRTFLKINNTFYEPFQNKILRNTNLVQRMYITSHTLKIEEIDYNQQLEFKVEYFTLPDENFPALMRIFSIKNVSNKNTAIECLDGLPLVIPYGLNDFMLKNVSRLAEGWYSGVYFAGSKKIPVYKLLVEPVDEPEVIYVEKANFYYGFAINDDERLDVKFIVDPDLIFGQFKDFTVPVGFINNEILTNQNLFSNNKTPCAFGYFQTQLRPNQELFYYSIVGNVSSVEHLSKVVNKIDLPEYFHQKKEENKQLINNLTRCVNTKSASKEFDGYCQQTFIDNFLRGGLPVILGEEKKIIYYVFSRVHGDMEREYNNFVITPEYFSQGNGHYRDVAQNRRNDIFFLPEVKDTAVVYFMNLVQLDGYNPLLLMGAKFKVVNKNLFLNLFSPKDREKIKCFINKEFEIGEFFEFIEKYKIALKHRKEKFLNLLIQHCEKVDNVYPLRGFWSDHWHYNIDLIESFVAVYPDEFENLLFNKRVFTFYDNPMVVLPRDEKYVLYHNKPRQMNAVYVHPEKQKIIDQRKEDKFVVRTRYGKGQIYKTTLFTKLLCLIANKYALLDPECVGVEMEADRPNWCDALNGLPGLFGSSTAESLELKRLILLLINNLEKINNKEKRMVSITDEIYEFIYGLYKASTSYVTNKNKFNFWQQRHNMLEKYRSRTLFGVSGKEKTIDVFKIINILKIFLKVLDSGLSKAIDPRTKLIYTYFENKITKYQIIRNKNGKVKTNHKGYVCIRPLEFKQQPLPYFLEGLVHYLRITNDTHTAKKIHKNVIKSELYDSKLGMLKLNAPLRNVSMEIGRIKVFTPGWLENESIWLHMEYKYLLELLRNNLAEEFWSAAKSMLIPFMDPHIYGRSIFENSSFIVSSAHPEKNLHGQGFVGRLSGSTAEFLSIWIAITCGLKPFFIKDGQLYLKFSPMLPSWLFTDEGKFEFVFLGKIHVEYVNKSKRDTFGKNKAEIKQLIITYNDGSYLEITGDMISPPHSYNIRDNKVSKITAIFS
ncbi:MAG: hypothetical protein N2555_03845 [Endomicrobia bacterium]|nr:hypothetical protein [Endomicrobiia bacterium]